MPGKIKAASKPEICDDLNSQRGPSLSDNSVFFFRGDENGGKPLCCWDSNVDGILAGDVICKAMA